MKRTRFVVLILVVAIAGAAFLTSPIAGQNNANDRQAQAALQAAINKEMVDGNLDVAIQQYKSIVSKFPKERPVVADALNHMAECYQKLGDAQAQKIYQQVLRDYADQPAAVTFARNHVGGAAASAQTSRKVWTRPNLDAEGRVSPDGKFITFFDWHWDRGSDSLMLHDISSQVDRPLTPPATNGSQNAFSGVISRDGKRFIYRWIDEDNRASFRIAALQAGRVPEPRQIFPPPGQVFSLASFDWSPDEKWIAAGIKRQDGTGGIALIGVTDGSFRIVKSLAGPNPGWIFFSPDGKYISYSLPAGDGSGLRNVFVLPIDGSGEFPPVFHGAVQATVGWSPDGTRLLFISDLAGSLDLWAVSVANGKGPGAPQLLKSDIGSTFPLGLTASGALYFWKRNSPRDTAIAPIDLEAGKLLGSPVGFTQGFLNGSRNPQWSPDGKYLAYAVTCNNGCVAIRSAATGEVRRVAPTLRVIPSLNNAQDVSWSPDGRSLLVVGTDQGGRAGIFEINVKSGEASTVVLGTGLSKLAQWSPDGKKIYFYRNAVLMERDLASGLERDVYRNEEGVRRIGSVSPDGQHFAVIRNGAEASLLLVPVAGGKPREVLHLKSSEYFVPTPVLWTPDSSAMIVTKHIDGTNTWGELLLVPVAGAPPRKLDIDPSIWMDVNDQSFSLSPDGRSLAFQMGKMTDEIWTLENFLPPSKTAPRGK